MKLFKSWILPILIAGAIFTAVKPALAQVIETPALEDVLVGYQIVDGYQQIYYVEGRNNRFITSGNKNSRSPHAAGEYIVYVGDVNEVGQIFLYHIPSQNTVQLTNSGSNLRPKVSSNGKVVWERWIENRWQIYFFSGSSVVQLTSGDASFNPNIEGNHITYTRQDITGTYRSVVYVISRGESKEVSIGIDSKHVATKDGKIYLSGEEFPLKVEDLFLLDLASLTSEETTSSAVVTEEDVATELEGIVAGLTATDSGTVSTEPTPEATGSASVATDSASLSD